MKINSKTNYPLPILGLGLFDDDYTYYNSGDWSDSEVTDTFPGVQLHFHQAHSYLTLRYSFME